MIEEQIILADRPGYFTKLSYAKTRLEVNVEVLTREVENEANRTRLVAVRQPRKTTNASRCD